MSSVLPSTTYGCRTSGIQTSSRVFAERGITPTTRSSLPFTRMLRPMTRGIPSEPPLPEQLADDRRRLGIRALIVGSQHAPERGSDAEFGKVVGGGKRHVDRIRD